MAASNRIWMAMMAVVVFANAAGAVAPCPSPLPVVIVPAGATAAEGGNNLRNAIEAAGNEDPRSKSCRILELEPGRTYEIAGRIHAGSHRRDGVWIANHDITLRGAPQGRTNLEPATIQFTRDTYIGIVIRPGTRNLVIRDLKLAGSLGPIDSARLMYEENSDRKYCDMARGHDSGKDASECFSSGARKPRYPGEDVDTFPNTHAIGVYGGMDAKSAAVLHVLITGLTIENVAVGINVGSVSPDGNCPANKFSHVTISGNRLRNMHGRDAGTGYGIVSSCASDVLIIDNVIQNTGRHAIYHGRTLDGGSALDDVRIIRNTTIDHGEVNTVLAKHNRSAICAARSKNVSIVANTIIDARQPGVSVESADDARADGFGVASNVAVIGNKFFHYARAPARDDIWLNAHRGRNAAKRFIPENVVIWANRVNSVPISRGVPKAKVDDQSGIAVDPPFWNEGTGTQWIEFDGAASDAVRDAGRLKSALLYVVRDNVLLRVTPDWGKPPAMAVPNSHPAAYITWPEIDATGDRAR